MSIPQVGQGSVSIVPTFKGFRKLTDAEFGSSAKSGTSIFNSGFRSAGSTAGKGFASSFDSATKGITANALKGAQADVAKASREVSALRLKEQDATGKVRLAESLLAEARRKYASDSSQVVRAEERLATAQRTSISSKTNLLGATERLTAAQRSLAGATNEAATAGGRSGGAFARLSNVFHGAGGDGAARFTTGFKDVLGGVLGANILTGIGYTIGRTIGDAARAGIGYGFEAVTLASDLEQSTGAVTAQFKDQAETIFAASRTSATSVGLSKATFQQYATVVGAQLKNLGLRQDQVSGKTIDLITLGADLAAQFGGPTSQAVEALSSLLRGERDPIERYGVSLKQTDIDARLAAMGLSGLTGEAEKQATVQATLALLWEQTADAQGTFFREQDTYAGKQQRLMAQLADAQTKFGETLLPTATDVLDFATNDLLPVLEGALSTAGPDLAASLRSSLPEIKKIVEEGVEAIPGAIKALTTGVKLFSDVVKGTNEILSFPGWGEFFGVKDPGTSNPNDYGAFAAQISNDMRLVRDESTTTRSALTGDLAALETEFGTSGGAMAANLVEKLKAGQGPSLIAGEGLGRAFTDGMAAGIYKGTGGLLKAARDVAYAVENETRGQWQVQSPSKKAAAIGAQWPAGLAGGMLSGQSTVASAARRLAGLTEGTTLQQLATATGSASAGRGASAGGGTFTGNLYLEGGQFLGVVRGVMQDHDQESAQAIRGGVTR